MRSLIGISGKIGSGKDSVGKIIQAYTAGLSHEEVISGMENYRNLDFHKIWLAKEAYSIKKFADKLKDIVCMLIGCTRKDLEDREFKEKILGPEWDKWRLMFSDDFDSYIRYFSTEEEAEKYIEDNQDKGRIYFNLERKQMSPRLLLQLLGTNCGREMIHPQIWVNSLFSDYKSEEYQFGTTPENLQWSEKYPNWIITDMRFPNEMVAIKSRDGITIRVERGQPSGPEHESETALDGAEFDYHIDNNGTIKELVEKVREILIKENIIWKV